MTTPVEGSILGALQQMEAQFSENLDSLIPRLTTLENRVDSLAQRLAQPIGPVANPPPRAPVAPPPQAQPQPARPAIAPQQRAAAPQSDHFYTPKRASELPTGHTGRPSNEMNEFLERLRKEENSQEKERLAREKLAQFEDIPKKKIPKNIYHRFVLELCSALSANKKFGELEHIVTALLDDASSNPSKVLSEQRPFLEHCLALSLVNQNKNFEKVEKIARDGIYYFEIGSRFELDNIQNITGLYQCLFCALEKLNRKGEIEQMIITKIKSYTDPKFRQLKNFLDNKLRRIQGNGQAAVSSSPQSSSAAAASSRQRTSQECLEEARRAPTLQDREKLAMEGLQLSSRLEDANALRAALCCELAVALLDLERFGEAQDRVRQGIHVLGDRDPALRERLEYIYCRILFAADQPYEAVQLALVNAFANTPTTEGQIQLHLLTVELLIKHGKETRDEVALIRQTYSDRPEIQHKVDLILNSAGMPPLEPMPTETVNGRGTKRPAAPEGERADSSKKAKENPS